MKKRSVKRRFLGFVSVLMAIMISLLSIPAFAEESHEEGAIAPDDNAIIMCQGYPVPTQNESSEEVTSSISLAEAPSDGSFSSLSEDEIPENHNDFSTIQEDIIHYDAGDIAIDEDATSKPMDDAAIEENESGELDSGIVTCDGYPIPPIPDDKLENQEDLSNYKNSSFVPLISAETRGLLSYITVYISSPCDQYWIADFPDSWMYMANYAIEEGDDFLAEKFNIDYISVSQVQWNNTNTDSYLQYNDAKNNIGKTGGADLMIAFSANQTNYGGLGASDGYAVVWYFNYAGIGYSCNTVTHESGHMYGVSHDGDCLTSCLMSGTPKTICSRCYNIWYPNRYKW